VKKLTGCVAADLLSKRTFPQVFYMMNIINEAQKMEKLVGESPARVGACRECMVALGDTIIMSNYLLKNVVCQK
jgi:hypothetical protein